MTRLHRWDTAARTMRAIGAFEAGGSAPSSEQIIQSTGIDAVAALAALWVLEGEGLIAGVPEDPAQTQAAPPGYRRSYRITDKGRQLDWVVLALFGAKMDASRLERTIVAALQLAVGSRLDGWVPDRTIAVICGIDPRAMLRGPVIRMGRAMERLREVGLLEGRLASDERQAEITESRLRLPWVLEFGTDGDADRAAE